MTAAKALFTSLPPGAPLPELLASSGRVLTVMDLPRLRMCLALVRLLPREAAVVSAAMPPLLLHRAATGEVEALGVGGLPLGGRLTRLRGGRTLEDDVAFLVVRVSPCAPSPSPR